MLPLEPTPPPRRAPDPLWKRVLGGVVGIALLVLVLVYARSQGVTAEAIGRWQGILVYAVGGPVALVWIVRYLRRRRR